ncbi:transporter substrate-binding domain-containing protein [Oxalobacteraceae bacterium]|nr:transporter substrate-binding domain-containing protein [Oxalobacteraceae bacterium]
MVAGLALLCCAPGAGAREWLVVGSHFEKVFERAAGGDFGGMGPEIVRAVARQMHDTVRFELYPWPRAQALIIQGKADILVGPYQSAERLAQMAFSERAFYQDEMVFYSRAQANLRWDGDYASLRNKRIVILNGWAYGAEFAAASARLNISIANSVENGLLMVAHQRVDLFATNRRNTEPWLATLKLGLELRPLPKVIEIQDGYFAFPRKASHEELRARFNQAFNALVDSGELKKLGLRFGVSTP